MGQVIDLAEARDARRRAALLKLAGGALVLVLAAGCAFIIAASRAQEA